MRDTTVFIGPQVRQLGAATLSVQSWALNTKCDMSSVTHRLCVCLIRSDVCCAVSVAVCGHADLIDYLQSQGTKLNRPDKHNAFALHYAAQMAGAKRGEEVDPKVGKRVLAKLLTKDVDVDCRDQDKRTPLVWAASSGEAVDIVS